TSVSGRAASASAWDSSSSEVIVISLLHVWPASGGWKPNRTQSGLSSKLLSVGRAHSGDGPPLSSAVRTAGGLPPLPVTSKWSWMPSGGVAVHVLPGRQSAVPTGAGKPVPPAALEQPENSEVSPVCSSVLVAE